MRNSKRGFGPGVPSPLPSTLARLMIWGDASLATVTQVPAPCAPCAPCAPRYVAWNSTQENHWG